MQLNTQADFSTSTPLEILVVHQLEQVLREEKLLAERYQQLGASGKNTDEMQLLSSEISRFDQRANRLLRLIQAMEGCYPTNAVDPSQTLVI
jgi:hypothetical protein